MAELGVPKFETKTTKDLLGLVSEPETKDSAEGIEAKDELIRRVGVVLSKDSVLGKCTFTFGNIVPDFSDFYMDVSITGNPGGHSDRFLFSRLGNLFYGGRVSHPSDYNGRMSVSISALERQLIDHEEPAGVYVDEDPLTFDQITPTRRYWANAQFDKAVQPNIGNYSTHFKGIEEIDGELRVRAGTTGLRGDDLLSKYILQAQPFGFYIKWGEPLPSGGGLYLHISFEDFKKLLPSTSVEEGVAHVANRASDVISQG